MIKVAKFTLPKEHEVADVLTVEFELLEEVTGVIHGSVMRCWVAPGSIPKPRVAPLPTEHPPIELEEL